jgi:hypothetical protein
MRVRKERTAGVRGPAGGGGASSPAVRAARSGGH